MLYFCLKNNGMNPDERIDAFVGLGKVLKKFTGGDRMGDPSLIRLEEAVQDAYAANPWFIPEFIETTLQYWSVNLERESLERWLSPYSERISSYARQKNVAVIMAGNIPLVGFHDFLSVLASGNQFTGRLSSDDRYLLPALAEILLQQDPGWKDLISFSGGKMTGFDAVIATGSNNSFNYFDYYFSKYPHIIRRNRNGIAVLTGKENDKELAGLAEDIFLYFGMGCRNVSKLYLPSGYDFDPLFRSFRKYNHFFNHHKWRNNYDYYKSVFLLNGIPTIDNGFVLLTMNPEIASPPANLYYEFYDGKEELADRLFQKKEEFQVMVSAGEFSLPSCTPGRAQLPVLNDYADGIDTMEFLLDLRDG